MPDILTAPGECAKRIREFLEREGLEAQLDADWPQGVFFAWNGYPHFVHVDEADGDFLRVCVGFQLAEGARDELRLLRTANGVQARTKVVKVLLPPSLECVGFQAEIFLDGRDLSRSLFRRCLGALEAAAEDFFRKWRAESPVRA